MKKTDQEIDCLVTMKLAFFCMMRFLFCKKKKVTFSDEVNVLEFERHETERMNSFDSMETTPGVGKRPNMRTRFCGNNDMLSRSI